VRVSFVTADDEYGHSVADATRSAVDAGGLTVLGESVYNPYTPDWAPVMRALAAERPDILVLSSHIQDGIAFRRAFLAAGLQVSVFMGTTMAQCDQDFGNVLGSGAVGPEAITSSGSPITSDSVSVSTVAGQAARAS